MRFSGAGVGAQHLIQTEAERVPKPPGLQPTEHLPLKELPTPPSACTGPVWSGKITPAVPGAEGPARVPSRPEQAPSPQGPRRPRPAAHTTRHTETAPPPAVPGFMTRREEGRPAGPHLWTPLASRPGERQPHDDGRLGGHWPGRTLAGRGQKRGLPTDTASSHGAGRARPRTGAPSGPASCPLAPWLGPLGNTAFLTPSPEPAAQGTCKKRQLAARKSPKPRWRPRQQEEGTGSRAGPLGCRQGAGGMDRRAEPTPRAHGPHHGPLGHQHGTSS